MTQEKQKLVEPAPVTPRDGGLNSNMPISRSARLGLRLLVGLAAPMLALTIGAMAAELPTPGGPFPVGMQRFELVDATRRGISGGEPDAARVLPVYVWYPARAGAVSDGRPYFNVEEQATQARSMARNFKYGETELDGLHEVIAHSVEGATPLPSRHGYPLIVFNHGFESYALQNTALMEHWASHGYVVVSIAHPGDAADLRLANGKLLVTSKAPVGDASVTRLRRLIRGNTASLADRSAALTGYSEAAPGTRLGRSQVAWSDDISFVVATMASGATPANFKAVLHEVDQKRLAITGMSFGGAVAVSACRRIAHCRASINLDGGNQDPSLFDIDPGRPLLLMQSDWTHTTGVDNNLSPNDFDYERWGAAGTNPNVVRLRLDGIKHMGYTDLILLMEDPGKVERFGSIEASAAVTAIGSATLAFLDEYLNGGSRRDLVSVLGRTSVLHIHDPASSRRLVAREAGNGGQR